MAEIHFILQFVLVWNYFSLTSLDVDFQWHYLTKSNYCYTSISDLHSILNSAYLIRFEFKFPVATINNECSFECSYCSVVAANCTFILNGTSNQCDECYDGFPKNLNLSPEKLMTTCFPLYFLAIQESVL